MKGWSNWRPRKNLPSKNPVLFGVKEREIFLIKEYSEGFDVYKFLPNLTFIIF